MNTPESAGLVDHAQFSVYGGLSVEECVLHEGITMNKSELIESLIEKMDTDRRTASAAVEAIIDTIVRAVHSGDSVTITGFGVFEQRRRAARVARNPRTGETVRVAETSVPSFRPGAQFKAVIAGEAELPASGSAVRRVGGGTAADENAE